MAQFFDPQQLATPEAPYIKYLESIKGEWIEAGILERTLKALAKDVKRCHKPVPATATRSDRTTIAEILDIQVDSNGNNKPLQAPNPSLEAFDGRVITHPTATSNFLHQLRTCSSNTHTRIIVLHGGRTKLGDSAFDSLFFCHVLGIELNLSPTDVRHLAQLDHSREDSVQATMDSQQLLPMKSGFVSLGFTEETRKRNVGAYLGRKRFGNASPQVVVVHLHPYDYGSARLASASNGIIWEPPAPFGNVNERAISATPEVFFRRAVRRCLESAAPLSSDDVTGSWVSALAHMDAVESTYSFHNLLTDWQGVSKIMDMYDLARSARKTCASLQTSINQVSAFRRNYPTARRSDYDEGSHMLERLLGEAKPLSEEIQVCINTRQQKDQHEETRLAIGESKNAVALTVLAFIFIPINTASSIFGMNVTEIGDSASIWVFVIVACALSVISGIGWWLWRRLGRFRQLGEKMGTKFKHRNEKIGDYL